LQPSSIKADDHLVVDRDDRHGHSACSGYQLFGAAVSSATFFAANSMPWDERNSFAV
jgi:hypothetical protein